MQKYKLIIIGSGPAGLTAAIYAARADLKPLVTSGRSQGGQLMLTAEVENYPGFPQGILGPDLMLAIRKQAERFGAVFVDSDVSAVDFQARPFEVIVDKQNYRTEAVIIATGAQAKWLGLANERRLIGKGVSSCATCDAFFFKNKQVIVVGGGDTAMEDALTLTKFAARVTIVHRRDSFSASKVMQGRVLSNPKIDVIWGSVIEDILGQDRVRSVVLVNLTTKAKTERPTDGVFVAIGYTPATDILKGQIELDEKGYVKRYRETETSVKGVFVAGDVEDYRYRQAITAAGSGCKAALDAEKYLS